MRNRHIDPETDFEVFQQLNRRYEAFKTDLDNPDTAPVKVFNPLKKSQIDQLEMIRDLSKSLQAKKDEDIRKQQQSAEEAEAEAEAASSEEKISEDKELPVEEETAVA